MEFVIRSTLHKELLARVDLLNVRKLDLSLKFHSFMPYYTLRNVTLHTNSSSY